MIDKILLTGAFEKMGPDAVERGLRGHQSLHPDGIWRTCFLVHAYNRGDALEKGLIASGWSAEFTVMGLTPDEFGAVWRSVDYDRAQFYALANEWLENRPAPLRAASRETAGVDTQSVGACRFGRGE